MAYAYVQTPERLIEFLKKISTIGIPSKVNIDYLKSIGYTSSNDRAFIGVLRLIGFIDGSGNASELWKEARVNLGTAVSKGLRLGYAGLYQTYPNAHHQGNEAVKNYFKANSDLGEAAVSRMASTFKALVGVATFSEAQDSADPIHVDSDPNPEPVRPGVSRVVTNSNGLTLNLNVELQVPADASGEIYDKFFAAMKKHLIDANT